MNGLCAVLSFLFSLLLWHLTAVRLLGYTHSVNGSLPRPTGEKERKKKKTFFFFFFLYYRDTKLPACRDARKPLFIPRFKIWLEIVCLLVVVGCCFFFFFFFYFSFLLRCERIWPDNPLISSSVCLFVQYIRLRLRICSAHYRGSRKKIEEAKVNSFFFFFFS